MNKKRFYDEVINLLKDFFKFYKAEIQAGELKVPASRASVEATIRQIAAEMDVDPDLAIRVAVCESGLNPRAINVNVNGTTDRGVYQWNDYWHPEVSDACAYDVECATRKFCQAVKDGHIDWWNASKKCWQR